MTASVLLLAAALSVSSGGARLGQSAADGEAPVPWAFCDTCANDARGDVYLTGGYVLRKGCVRPEVLERTVPGTLVSDGRDLFAWRPASGTIHRVVVTSVGLEDGGELCSLGAAYGRFGLAPHGTRRGFAAKAKVVFLDVASRTVRGWTADGAPLGVLLDYGKALRRPDLACGVGILDGSGDLLVATSHHPEPRVHRFTADGREVTSGAWPCAVLGTRFQFAGGKTWALGCDAVELGEVPGRGLSFGVNAYAVQGIARGVGGWWLGTSQGAQFYPDGRARAGCPATRRIGGLPDVDALALRDGRVYARSGNRVYALWLDDRPDEPFSSDMMWTAKRFPEGKEGLTDEGRGWSVRYDSERKAIIRTFEGKKAEKRRRR